MAGHGQEFAARLRVLREHAGSPTYDAIAAHGRMQRPPAKFADATLSGWFDGTAVPKNARAFIVLVAWLESRARRYAGHQALDVRGWEALRLSAWHERHAGRRSGPAQGLDEQVRGYLEAARKAAKEHPYPGAPDHADPAPLAKVYVGQRVGLAVRDSRDLGVAEPAEVVFESAEGVCVLIAGPGGGKSTLLRTGLRDMADEWLGDTQRDGKTDAVVPVLVSAQALASEETSIPAALAEATRKLSRYGLHAALDEARFLRHPCTGAHWAVLVDGLDELPNATERRAVLEKVAHAVDAAPSLYRCVVATRPLAENELDVLDRVLDHPAPRYNLQPFTAEDLGAYAGKCFGNRWPQEQADRRAGRFVSALNEVSLAELASTPLMAFMLCQLYLANPENSLPDGRTAVYDAFTDLIYEKNHGKHVGASHEEAIVRLVEGVQSPRARDEVDKAARQVHERLSDLIDYLAHQWLTSHPGSAAAILASHEAVHCPSKVHSKDWNAFVEDLLRHTGLLTQRATALGFPHQTFLEFHAARHATRDARSRRQTLHVLFDTHQKDTVSGKWEERLWYESSSYVGFLLDRLLIPKHGVAIETARSIEGLLTQQRQNLVHHFVATQTRIRTNLPATTLTRLAADTRLDPSTRVAAATGLARVKRQREAGAALLISLAEEATPSTDATALSANSHARVTAARELSNLQGYRDAGATLLARLADDVLLDACNRVGAYTRVRWASFRVGAAVYLAQAEGYQDAGVAALTCLAQEATLDSGDRLRAARGVVRVSSDAGVPVLAILAGDATLDSNDRLEAARDVTRLDRDAGAALLARLAEGNGTGLTPSVTAGRELAKVEGSRDAGAALLIQIAGNTTLGTFPRLQAARAVTQVAGYWEVGITLLTHLAEGAAPSGSIHANLIHIAWQVAGVRGYRDAGAALLIRLAENPTADGADRAWAARDLVRMKGYRDTGTALLNRLADDQSLDPANRAWAAKALVSM